MGSSSGWVGWTGWGAAGEPAGKSLAAVGPGAVVPDPVPELALVAGQDAEEVVSGDAGGLEGWAPPLPEVGGEAVGAGEQRCRLGRGFLGQHAQGVLQGDGLGYDGQLEARRLSCRRARRARRSRGG